jgi:hypothetical protein
MNINVEKFIFYFSFLSAIIYSITLGMLFAGIDLNFASEFILAAKALLSVGLIIDVVTVISFSRRMFSEQICVPGILK